MKPDYRADFETVCNLADYGDAEQNCGLTEPAIERIRVLGPKLLALWDAMNEQFDSTDGYLHEVGPVREAFNALSDNEEEAE